MPDNDDRGLTLFARKVAELLQREKDSQDKGVVSGPVDRFRPAGGPAASSTRDGGGYPRAERQETPEERTERFRKKAEALPPARYAPPLQNKNPFSWGHEVGQEIGERYHDSLTPEQRAAGLGVVQRVNSFMRGDGREKPDVPAVRWMVGKLHPERVQEQPQPDIELDEEPVDGQDGIRPYISKAIQNAKKR